MISTKQRFALKCLHVYDKVLARYNLVVIVSTETGHILNPLWYSIGGNFYCFNLGFKKKTTKKFESEIERLSDDF